MSGHLDPKLTGRTRHRIHVEKRWLRRPRQRLIMQHEVEGFVPEYLGGRVDGRIRRWWVDSKPEWVMQDAQP